MNENRELFKGTAWHYSRYRKGYPQAFFDYIIDKFSLNEYSRVLDLGVGTGQIAIPIAPFVKEVVALDPEEGMLEEGKMCAEEKNITNITWLQSKAEDISEELGSFDVTTMGAAFHWMDRKSVLEKVYEITKDGGGVVIVSDFRRGTAPQHGEDWKKARKDVIAKYLGERRRAGNSFFVRGDDKFEDRLTESPFGGYEVWNYDFNRSWTLDEAVNWLYSTSFASKRLLGNNLENFEKELREKLLELKPNGNFSEEVRLQALVGRKLVS